MKRLSEHFVDAEFRCHCCGKLPYGGMSDELIRLLERIRQVLGVPIIVNSGYRCPKHNEALRKKDPKVGRSSQHMLGTAADIATIGHTPAEIARVAGWILKGRGGIGVYRTFTHVDVRRNRARW